MTNENSNVIRENPLEKYSVFLLAYFLLIAGLILSYILNFKTAKTEVEFIGFLLPIISLIISGASVFLFFRKEFFTYKSEINYANRNYTYRATLVYGVALILTAIFSALFAFSTSDLASLSRGIYDGTTLIIGAIILLWAYLSTDERDFHKRLDDEEEIDEDDTEEIDPMENAIWEDYPKGLTKWSDKVEFRMIKMIDRLVKQKDTISKQSNVNLILGCSIALAGIVALLIILYLPMYSSSESFMEKINYASRLTLVAFIELLAFFFLRLHKQAIQEKKYYQREITDIELKYLGLITAHESKSDENMSNVLNGLGASQVNQQGEQESESTLKSINSTLKELLKLTKS